MILLLTNEYNYRTNRQNVIDGLSRTQFAASKLLLMTIFAILTTVVTFITVIVVGLHVSPNTSSLWNNISFIGYFFVQSIIYLLAALLLAMLVKRSGLAIGLYFFLMIADTIVGLVLNKYVHPLGYFLPIDGTDWLIQNPASKFLKDDARPDQNLILGFSVAYIIGLGYLFIHFFKKADLK
jgi:ABC-type transport system involved in multi-copper enzyme maturation permease subunit